MFRRSEAHEQVGSPLRALCKSMVSLVPGSPSYSPALLSPLRPLRELCRSIRKAPGMLSQGRVPWMSHDSITVSLMSSQHSTSQQLPASSWPG